MNRVPSFKPRTIKVMWAAVFAGGALIVGEAIWKALQ